MLKRLCSGLVLLFFNAVVATYAAIAPAPPTAATTAPDSGSPNLYNRGSTELGTVLNSANVVKWATQVYGNTQMPMGNILGTFYKSGVSESKAVASVFKTGDTFNFFSFLSPTASRKTSTGGDAQVATGSSKDFRLGAGNSGDSTAGSSGGTVGVPPSTVAGSGNGFLNAAPGGAVGGLVAAASGIPSINPFPTFNSTITAPNAAAAAQVLSTNLNTSAKEPPSGSAISGSASGNPAVVAAGSGNGGNVTGGGTTTAGGGGGFTTGLSDPALAMNVFPTTPVMSAPAAAPAGAAPGGTTTAGAPVQVAAKVDAPPKDQTGTSGAGGNNTTHTTTTDASGGGSETGKGKVNPNSKCFNECKGLLDHGGGVQINGGGSTYNVDISTEDEAKSLKNIVGELEACSGSGVNLVAVEYYDDSENIIHTFKLSFDSKQDDGKRCFDLYGQNKSGRIKGAAEGSDSIKHPDSKPRKDM